jgi:acetyl-CoA carboxylase biotin carboxyl carrier protein
MDLTVDIIKDLIGSLGRAGIDKLSLETSDFKLALEKNQPVYTAVSTVAAPAAAAQQPAAPCEEAAENPCGNVVTSPIVGTFFASASPDKPAFVRVGQQVKKGETLFIVESMKLMNEIASEFDGTVAEIYAKNGMGVEYGQPIMRIE